MKKLEFKVSINAPAHKVFDRMLGLSDKTTYEEWTKAFHPTATYEGKWEKGSKILFIGTDSHGERGGMVSKVVDIIPNRFVSVQHYGIVKGNQEITEGLEVEKWGNGFENYIFEEINGYTVVIVNLETPEHFVDYMQKTFPVALEGLKKICEE